MTDPQIETLIADFYAAFDNRNGRRIDGPALRAMFIDHAVITRVSGGGTDSWTPEAFIAPRVKMLSDGTLSDFHEWETEADTRILGRIACRRSSYAKQGRLDGADYRGGGHKFIQLLRQASGWRIAAILWEDSPAPEA